MREILFRGKRIDGGEWIEGYYLRDVLTMPDELTHFIATPWGFSVRMFEVYPHTVGQFTGLYDSTKWEDLSEAERAAFVRDGNLPSEWKGKKIFEGDIVHAHDRLLKGCGPFHEFDGVIGYRDGSFVIEGDLITHYRWMIDYDVTVLGNIHDNPELLEVQHD